METMVLPAMAGGLVGTAVRALEAGPVSDWPANAVEQGRGLFRCAADALLALRDALEAELDQGTVARPFVARWGPVLDGLERDAPAVAAAVPAAPRALADDLRAASDAAESLRSRLREVLATVRAALAKPIDMEAVRAAEERMKAGHFVTHEQLEKELLGK